MEQKEFAVNLTDQEWKMVAMALGQMPYNQVAIILQKIIAQISDSEVKNG